MDNHVNIVHESTLSDSARSKNVWLSIGTSEDGRHFYHVSFDQTWLSHECGQPRYSYYCADYETFQEATQAYIDMVDEE